MATRQIVAIGGGGVSQDPDNPHLLDFLVGLTSRDRPKVCLVPTASGDREANLVTAYRAFSRRGCEVSHLNFFRQRLPFADHRHFQMNPDGGVGYDTH